jgi:tetratricopeptide (TPR) repeat protein
MERDVPWKARYLRDVAALRCKQMRQLDAVTYLRRLAELVPSDVGAMRNLSLVCSQLGEVEEAKVYHEEPQPDDRDDLWSTALVRQSVGGYDDAAQMLGRALHLHKDASPADTVTEAKIRWSFGSCLDLMGRHQEAVQHLTQAQALLSTSVGSDHPQYGGVCEALSLAMVHAGRPKQAFDLVVTAFTIRAAAESTHPTALFELLVVALEDCVDSGGVDASELARLEEPMGVAMANLHLRRMDRDANAAILFERVSQVLLRCSPATGGKEQQTNAARRRSRARKMLQRASSLLVDATARGESFAHTRELITLQFEVLDVQDAIWHSQE